MKRVQIRYNKDNACITTQFLPYLIDSAVLLPFDREAD